MDDARRKTAAASVTSQYAETDQAEPFVLNSKEIDV
jgi:hypothetical protein